MRAVRVRRGRSLGGDGEVSTRVGAFSLSPDLSPPLSDRRAHRSSRIPTLFFQQSLLRLPVPSLEDTIAR
jgi:hypothetical protein